MFAGRLFSRTLKHQQFVRNLSFTTVFRMPFAKHEIVPDVIKVAPKDIAKVDYISGGDYLIKTFLRSNIYL
jgi:hypothetical protein